MGADPVTAAAVTAGGSIAGGLLGGKKQTQSSTTKPYLSPEVEAGYKELMDRGMALSNQEMPVNPVARVGAPTSIFDNPDLYRYQLASDAMGGLLSPLRNGGSKKPTTTPADTTKKPVTPTQEGTANKASGKYYDYETAKRLAAQGIMTPSYTAYIDDLLKGGVK